ncbi:MAG: tetratricopeptide repeat protein [Candidatus Babeliales bacterium]
MPLPFYVIPFFRQNNNNYVCYVGYKDKKSSILTCLFNILSANLNFIDDISKMSDGMLLLNNILIILKERTLYKIFFKDDEDMQNSDNVTVFAISEFHNLLYEWHIYQKGRCDVVVFALIDSAYLINGFYRELYDESAFNEKKLILAKFQLLCAKVGLLDNVLGEQIEAILVNHLCKYPQNVDSWLQLTMLEFSMSWKDPYRMENYLTNALSFDKENIYALLFLAYADWLHRGEVRLEVLNSLSKLNVDSEHASMIEFANALGTMLDYPEKYEQHLLRSIALCNKHVNNYSYLGKFYGKRNRISEALVCYKHALNNIQYIDNSENLSCSDAIDIQSFFDFYYKGIRISEYLKKDLEIKIAELEIESKEHIT